MRVLILMALLTLSSQASALVRYSYTGKPFTLFEDVARVPGAYDSSMSLRGFFELDEAIAADTALGDITADVLSFSFSDGRNTLTQADILVTPIFAVRTDAAGRIDRWSIFISQDLTLTAFGDRGILLSTQNDPEGAMFSAIQQDQAQLYRCSEFDPPGICHTVADTATVLDTPGSWVLERPTVEVAEPPADLAVMASILGWIAAVGVRRRRSMRPRR